MRAACFTKVDNTYAIERHRYFDFGRNVVSLF